MHSHWLFSVRSPSGCLDTFQCSHLSVTHRSAKMNFPVYAGMAIWEIVFSSTPILWRNRYVGMRWFKKNQLQTFCDVYLQEQTSKTSMEVAVCRLSCSSFRFLNCMFKLCYINSSLYTFKPDSPLVGMYIHRFNRHAGRFKWYARSSEAKTYEFFPFFNVNRSCRTKIDPLNL